MSLHFALKVNGHSIYHAMDITRLDHTDKPDPDATYRYRARACTADGTNPATQYDVTIEHRYGDGAWELIRKALNAMLNGDQAAADA